ncbi:MAG: T9SS type A sorting domain-containing protein, partial [Bacteroidota bacterium]
RFVEFFAGTDSTILADDRIDVQISTDCGDTYETIFTIDSTNHVPSTAFANIQLPLEPFNLEGTGINVRFVTTWSAGDYWSDFDNINITGCPASFVLDANIVNATGLTNNDGSITITPTFGEGPFSYDWVEFPLVEGPQLSGIEPGIYDVKVTDANGCVEEVSYTVLIDEPSSAIEVDGFDAVRLSPNPSPGQVLVSVEMLDAEDLTIDIFDAVGKAILSREVQAANLINESIDLEAQASGLYFVRLRTETRLHMERLILSK